MTLSFPRTDFDLVALDLDGTVICPEGKRPVSTQLREMVDQLVRLGVNITFVTGRCDQEAIALANSFSIQVPLVTYNGARLVDPLTSHVLWEEVIELESAETIATWFAESALVACCYGYQDRNFRLWQNRSSGDEQEDDYLFGRQRALDPSFAQAKSSLSSVQKFLVYDHPGLWDLLEREFGHLVHVVKTHERILELLPKGANKGVGVEKLCQHLGILPIQVLAIGDQQNDIASFKVCGFSVAMGDAPELVKEAADLVTLSFAEDGCAHALSELLRQKNQDK